MNELATLEIKIRPARKDDAGLYLGDMEMRNCNNPMTAKELIAERYNHKNRNWYIIFVNNECAGYVLFEDKDDYVTILRLVVENEYRRIGLATKLINHLKGRKKHVEAWVSEYNLAFQVCLRKNGFLTVPKKSPRAKGRMSIDKRREDGYDCYYHIYQYDS